MTWWIYFKKKSMIIPLKFKTTDLKQFEKNLSKSSHSSYKGKQNKYLQ